MPAVTANVRASSTSDAWLLPPSPTPKWFTSTSDRATVTSLGCARVPFIRASAVRHGSVPPHLAESPQSPSPPFHSTVVSALNANAPVISRQTSQTVCQELLGKVAGKIGLWL